MNGPPPSSASGTISWIASRNALKEKSIRPTVLISHQGANMISTATRIEDATLSVTQEIHVRASLDATFAALLEQLGPYNDTPDRGPMPMKLEAWPGGRWYRELGAGNGHFWGYVQAIKRPTLLEFSGPLFISYP